MIERFSDRQGYRPPAAQITIREDAPSDLRHAIPLIAQEAGMTPSDMRKAVCMVLRVAPDESNWSDYPNVWDEVNRLVREAPWYKIYDIAEALYKKLDWKRSESAEEFEQSLNDFFVEKGIGWELLNGQIVHRGGSEAFTKSAHEIPDCLEDADCQRAANEMREALRDISRRPEPDSTGAIQHAMAALEATARKVTNETNPTLGKLIPKLNLPSPLDRAVHKLWGYASDRGRHIREEEPVNDSEAELIVAIAGSLCAFLVQRDV